MIRSLCLLLVLSLSFVHRSGAAFERLHDPAEAQLINGLNLLEQGQLDAALGKFDAVLAAQPSFKLGHAVRAEVIARLAGQESFLGSYHELASLRHEAEKRLTHQPIASRQQQRVPINLLAPSQGDDTIILVDLTANRLYQYERVDSSWRLTGDHYVTIGKSGAGKRLEGDNRTPIGIYRVQSFIPDESLPELYGLGALPLDYPNAWDDHKRRTGHGIWIHGQPRDSYARPPHDSEGCIVISNRAVPGLLNASTFGKTPVILARSIRWVDRDTLASMRRDLEDTLETWRASWARGDIDRFMALHAVSYRNEYNTRSAFELKKRSLASNGGAQHIDLNDREMLLFEDTDGRVMAEVRFTQKYRASNYRETSQKTQYWTIEKGTWQLALEFERTRQIERESSLIPTAGRGASKQLPMLADRSFPSGR